MRQIIFLLLAISSVSFAKDVSDPVVSCEYNKNSKSQGSEQSLMISCHSGAHMIKVDTKDLADHGIKDPKDICTVINRAIRNHGEYQIFVDGINKERPGRSQSERAVNNRPTMDCPSNSEDFLVWWENKRARDIACTEISTNSNQRGDQDALETGLCTKRRSLSLPGVDGSPAITAQ